MTLAYVFWHAPASEQAGAGYEAALQRFHDVLRLNPALGFIGSRVIRFAAVPWLRGHAPVYEDWYLLNGSEALDHLNAAAITGARKGPHGAAAAMAAAGTAGLYRLRHGPLTPAPAVATWFSKPKTQTYDDLFTAVTRGAAVDTALWSRVMVLGPTPEFCFHTSAKLAYSPMESPIALRVESSWDFGL